MAWVKMYILSKKQWPAFKYNVWQCNGFSCHINNLSKNILSNAIGCGPNAMSYCPLVCNKLFQIKPTVQMVILLRPFLHEYVFTWSSQNYRVGEKKNTKVIKPHVSLSLHTIKDVHKIYKYIWAGFPTLKLLSVNVT